MGLIVICLFCFAVAFCPFKYWFHLAGEERELGALVCSEFPVASVVWIFLVVPWVGLSYVVVAFPGHTHLPVGFPVASQAKYFCELAIRFHDEQVHKSFCNVLFLCMSSFTRPQNNNIY